MLLPQWQKQFLSQKQSAVHEDFVIFNAQNIGYPTEKEKAIAKILITIADKF